MKFQLFGLVAVAALVPLSPAMAADTMPSYDDSIRCASFNTVMFGLQDKDDDPQDAAQFAASATEWLTYAYTFGNGEEQTDTHFNDASEELTTVLISGEINEDELTRTLTEVAVNCATAMVIYQDQIDAAVAAFAARQ